MHALDAGAAGIAWTTLARNLPRPRAVLIASAHWETVVPMLTGAARLDTVHDFSGFPPPLYALRYDVPGSPQLAQRAAAMLADAGIESAIDNSRGIDHGAWVPLRFMYPHADIPVVQLSLQTALGTEHHWKVGRALSTLADEGILIIGSGHVTHNLRDWRGADGDVLPYAQRFADWLADRIAQADQRTVVDYREANADAARSHPSEEHFLPLLVAWGAASADATPQRFHQGIEGGALAMDAYAFWPADNRGAMR